MIGDKRNTRGSGEKPVWAVLGEIAKLLCLLCWKGIKALGRLILKALKVILKWVVKGLLWLIDSTRWLVRKTRDFWNDNNTQEKLRKIGRGLKNALLALLAGIWIVLIYIGKGIVWLLKKLFVGLLHLRTTLKLFGKWIVRISVRFWNWLKRQGKNIKAWGAKKKQQYKSFRKTNGFKGLLIDMRDALRGSISNYIENDQQSDKAAGTDTSKLHTETDVEDPVTIDSDSESENENEEEVKGIRKFGRKIYKAMKRLVEV